MAGTKRADRHRAVHAATAPARAGQVAAEVPPPARVHRSRLAFAMSVTLAAVPILALDNFPATADTGERTSVEATAAADIAEGDLRVVRVDVEPVTETPPNTEPTTPPADDVVEPAAASEPVAAPSPAPVAAKRASTPAAPARPAPAPTTTTAPPPPSSPGDPNDPVTWDRLARCESGGQWALNSGNGYYGGLQFSLATWRDVGGTGYPHEASRDEQIKRGKMLQARYGWGQWPYCSRELGYR